MRGIEWLQIRGRRLETLDYYLHTYTSNGPSLSYDGQTYDPDPVL